MNTIASNPESSVESASPVAFATFSHDYQLALGVIQTAFVGSDHTAKINAVRAFSALYPKKTTLPASASKWEKRDCRDTYADAVAVHQRAVREMQSLARDAGFELSNKFTGSVSTSGAISIRENVTLKLRAPKFDKCKF